MNYTVREETWFNNVSDYEIEDIAKGEFGIIAPVVTKERTIRGSEYYRIDGLKFDKAGLSRRVVLNLSSAGPVYVRNDGHLMINFDKVNANLVACKNYIHFMDKKNLGREIMGYTYKHQIEGLYDYINTHIDLYGDNLPEEEPELE